MLYRLHNVLSLDTYTREFEYSKLPIANKISRKCANFTETTLNNLTHHTTGYLRQCELPHQYATSHIPFEATELLVNGAIVVYTER